MEQKPPKILQAKTSFSTIIGFLSATSFIQNLLKNIWVLLELGPLPWRQMNFTFLHIFLSPTITIGFQHTTFSTLARYYTFSPRIIECVVSKLVTWSSQECCSEQQLTSLEDCSSQPPVLGFYSSLHKYVNYVISEQYLLSKR